MIKYITATACICLLLASSQLFARDETGAFLIMGAGNLHCGEMTDMVQVGGAQGTINEQAFRSWILGYLTGVNVQTTGAVDFFAELDQVSAYKYVLKYCEDNPLDRVFVAVNKIVIVYKGEAY